MGNQVNLRLALNELMDEDRILGCGFGDRNGLTLAKEGDITRYNFC